MEEPKKKRRCCRKQIKKIQKEEKVEPEVIRPPLPRKPRTKRPPKTKVPSKAGSKLREELNLSKPGVSGFADLLWCKEYDSD
jgi:hypothetical protein